MKKKVLHILSSSGFSGAENVAMCIINNLSEEYEFAYTCPKGGIVEILESRNIKYIPIDKLSILKIKKVIKYWKPDIIHAHDFTASIKSLFASINIPVISHIHQNPTWLRRCNLYSSLFFLSCLKIKEIIVVTPVIKESTVLSTLFNKKTTIIKNVVDMKWIAEKANSPSLKLYDIAFIGRFEDVKDPLRFISIIAQLVKEIPQVKVIMAGGGSLKGKCEESIIEKGLHQNIDIVDFISNPFPTLKNSKILVMTSKSEGLPMIVIEALSLGKPVIVPQLEGLDSLIDSSCGFICRQDIEFVNGIAKLLKSNKDYFEMSKNAIEKANKIFNIDEYKNQIIKVYNNVL